MSSQGEPDGVYIDHHLVAYESPSVAYCQSLNLSPDGTAALLVEETQDGLRRAIVVHLSGPKCKQDVHLPLADGDSIIMGTISENYVAVASENKKEVGKVSVWRSAELKEEVLSKSSPKHKMLPFCDLSRTGDLLVSSFIGESGSDVYVTNISDGRDLYHCHRDGLSFPIFYEEANDGSGVLLLVECPLSSFELADMSLTIWDSLRNSFMRIPIDLKVCQGNQLTLWVDAKGDLIAVADANNLRLWHGKDGHVGVLPNCISRIQRREAVAFSRIAKGSRLVTAVSEGCFGVWDLKHLVRIATLRTHSKSHAWAFSISDDGATIATFSSDKKLWVWSIPPPVEYVAVMSSPSRLETYFAKVLVNPAVLDIEMVLQSINKDHVKSASDLLAGHNIVLLAIRSGVITRENIRSIGATQWYLQENLYLPATKLIHEAAALIDPILLHAEHLGIISHGYMLKVVRELRADMSVQMSSMDDVVVSLSGRLDVLERRVEDVESRTSSLEDNTAMLDSAVTGLHSTIEQLSLNQQNLNRAVQGLAKSLTKLQANIRKRDRRMTYASIARCMLSLIPFVGSSLADAASVSASVYSTTKILTHLTMEDLVPAGIDGVKHVVSGVAGNVDLSNFQVVRHSFSSATLSKLPSALSASVHLAVSKSSFESLGQLEAVLKQEIADAGAKDIGMSFVDVASSTWLASSSGSCSSSRSRKKWEEKAGLCFKFATCEQRGDEKLLSIELAKLELNRLLREGSGLSEVGGERIEEAFFKLAVEDEDRVNERIFVGMFVAICSEQEEEVEMERLMQKYAQMFTERAMPRRSVSLRMGARMIYRLGKELVKEGTIQAESLLEEGKILEQVKEFDVDASGTIEEKEFLEATRKLLHGL